jgi:hypothetical protein
VLCRLASSYGDAGVLKRILYSIVFSSEDYNI